MTLTRSMQQLAVASAVGAGVSGGVFAAFSTFVMPALKALPAPIGLAAMQSINLKAPNPLFMTALFGPALSSVVLMAAVRHDPDVRTKALVLTGGAIYLLGIATTLAFHIPKNNALARLDPHASTSVVAWSDYLRTWTAGNHVRALCSIAASVTFTIASR